MRGVRSFVDDALVMSGPRARGKRSAGLVVEIDLDDAGAYLEVLGAITWPHDEKRRRQFTAVYSAMALYLLEQRPDLLEKPEPVIEGVPQTLPKRVAARSRSQPSTQTVRAVAELERAAPGNGRPISLAAAAACVRRMLLRKWRGGNGGRDESASAPVCRLPLGAGVGNRGGAIGEVAAAPTPRLRAPRFGHGADYPPPPGPWSRRPERMRGAASRRRRASANNSAVSMRARLFTRVTPSGHTSRVRGLTGKKCAPRRSAACRRVTRRGKQERSGAPGGAAVAGLSRVLRGTTASFGAWRPG